MLRAALAIGAFVIVSAPAFASYDQALETCKTFAANNNTSPEPCACIAKAIGDKPELLAVEASLKTLDDYNAAPEAYRAAVDPCLPEDQRSQSPS